MTLKYAIIVGRQVMGITKDDMPRRVNNRIVTGARPVHKEGTMSISSSEPGFCKIVDNTITCKRPDGSMYARVSRSQWEEWRKAGRLDYELAKRRRATPKPLTAEQREGDRTEARRRNIGYTLSAGLKDKPGRPTDIVHTRGKKKPA